MRLASLLGVVRSLMDAGRRVSPAVLATIRPGHEKPRCVIRSGALHARRAGAGMPHCGRDQIVAKL
jgi:hypothetical protein